MIGRTDNGGTYYIDRLKRRSSGGALILWEISVDSGRLFFMSSTEDSRRLEASTIEHILGTLKINYPKDYLWLLFNISLLGGAKYVETT